MQEHEKAYNSTKEQTHDEPNKTGLIEYQTLNKFPRKIVFKIELKRQNSNSS